MKIILIHGDDTAKSYDRLKKFIETARDRSWEVSNIDVSSQSFQENLSSASLFGAERFFILRDVKILGKKETEWLVKKYKDLDGTLILYSEGPISLTLLKTLPKDSKIEEFKLPKLIWTFLEHLYKGNSLVSIKEFHRVIEKEAPEFVFSLIAKQFRDLYWVKTDPSSLQYQPWRILKLKSQSSHFSEVQLKKMIAILSRIDIDVKTSKANLIESLDLFILEQLE